MASKQKAGEVLRRFPLATGCVAIGVVGLLALGFRFGALSEAEALRDQQDAESKKVAKNVTNAAGIEDDVQALQADVARLEAMLINVDDVSSNQAYFYGLESESGVRMSILRPTGSSKNVPKNAPYLPAGYNVVIEGSYAQAIAFVRALEQGSRLYRLVDFTLQRSSQGGAPGAPAGGVVLNLNLQLLAAK